MRIGCVIVGMLCIATLVRAAEPTTKPVRKRPALSMREAENSIGLLGPVRVANYTRTFLPPKVDPHQQYKDRYMYGAPACSPYFGWGWYGYGCYPSDCFYGFHYEGWISPSGAFYGD